MDEPTINQGNMAAVCVEIVATAENGLKENENGQMTVDKNEETIFDERVEKEIIDKNDGKFTINDEKDKVDSNRESDDEEKEIKEKITLPTSEEADNINKTTINVDNDSEINRSELEDEVIMKERKSNPYAIEESEHSNSNTIREENDENSLNETNIKIKEENDENSLNETNIKIKEANDCTEGPILNNEAIKNGQSAITMDKKESKDYLIEESNRGVITNQIIDELGDDKRDSEIMKNTEVVNKV